MALVEVFSLSHLRRAFYKGARARAMRKCTLTLTLGEIHRAYGNL